MSLLTSIMFIKHMSSNTTEMTTSSPVLPQRVILVTLDVLTAVVSKLQLSISGPELFEAIVKENEERAAKQLATSFANRPCTDSFFFVIFSVRFFSLIAKPSVETFGAHAIGI